MTESNLAVRCRVIRDLLERYSELVDPLNSRDGVAGDGGSVGLMPATYTASVREVERLLRRMREDRSAPLVTIAQGGTSRKASVRSLWWHLNARFIAATTKIQPVTVTRKTKSGKRLRVVERQPVSVYDKRVDQTLVDAGVLWVAIAWGLKSEPMLPSELLVAA